MFLGLSKRLREALTASDSDRQRALQLNTHRIFFVSLTALPVSIAHIVIFAFGISADEAQEHLWRRGIIISHSILSAMMAILALASRLAARTKRRDLWEAVVQYLGVGTVCLAGVGITAVDQLVRDEITPYLIASILLALIFTLEPAVSLTSYAVTFALYVYAMTITQTNEIILYSNYANGITATGIGVGLSLLLWNSFVNNNRQETRIRLQQEEIEKKNKALERLASTDPLTGIANRRAFEDAVAKALSEMRRTSTQACLAIIDIDDFKSVNDQYGHPVGDELLRSVAELLRSGVRPNVHVSRWGGEEFIVFLPETSLEEGRLIVDGLRKAIESQTFRIQGKEFHVTASFGLASVDQTSENPFYEAYRKADQALYSAKEAGKNQISIS